MTRAILTSRAYDSPIASPPSVQLSSRFPFRAFPRKRKWKRRRRYATWHASGATILSIAMIVEIRSIAIDSLSLPLSFSSSLTAMSEPMAVLRHMILYRTFNLPRTQQHEGIPRDSVCHQAEKLLLFLQNFVSPWKYFSRCRQQPSSLRYFASRGEIPLDVASRKAFFLEILFHRDIFLGDLLAERGSLRDTAFHLFGDRRERYRSVTRGGTEIKRKFKVSWLEWYPAGAFVPLISAEMKVRRIFGRSLARFESKSHSAISNKWETGDARSY